MREPATHSERDRLLRKLRKGSLSYQDACDLEPMAVAAVEQAPKGDDQAFALLLLSGVRRVKAKLQTKETTKGDPSWEPRTSL